MIDVTGFNRRRREIAKQHVQLEGLSYNELRAIAKNAKIEGYSRMNKEELVEALKRVKKEVPLTCRQVIRFGPT